MAYILGISSHYHDSAAALIKDGQILAAVQEERFTRKKADSQFPEHSIRFVLEEAGIDLDQVDHIVYYEKPYLKFERLLETYHEMAPSGLRSFLIAIPVWIKEKLFLKKLLKDQLKQISGTGRSPHIYFSEHHLSHAASAFYPSPFEKAAILTLDGVGEWATGSLCVGDGNSIKMLKEIRFPHSLGLLYSAFTYYCGFKVNSGEYKLMGLAPYGHKESQEVKEYIKSIKTKLVRICEDGSFFLSLEYFDFVVGLTMTKDKKWEDVFGISRRLPETEITQNHMNLALAIQTVTEEIVSKLAKTACELAGTQNLVMAGGVALNCVANGKLLENHSVENLWIQPAAGDAGGALGAALAYYYLNTTEKRVPEVKDSMRGAYLGPAFSAAEAARSLKKYSARFEEVSDEEELSRKVADFIDEGKVIGWYQGQMEYGPRALGNRSIIADARSKEMQKRLNLKIKYREGFRPFAPAVLEEDLEQYFELSQVSPYMLLVAQVKKEIMNELPEKYESMSMYERLYVQRSSLPAITHIDGSARVQSVSQKTNPKFWNLINRFKQKTGCSVIVNTSFNVRGEPIVCTPEQAYVAFMRTQMDVLVIENLIFLKEQQAGLKEDKDWREEFELD